MTIRTENIDCLVLGAGAAGMMAAIEAGRRGRSVLVVDHARAPGEKIRISGGGRCNFTNMHTAPANFLSANPHFAKSALARFRPADFVDRVRRHNIPFHEKALGQLFCDRSSTDVVRMLTDDMADCGARLRLSTDIGPISRADDGRFRVETGQGVVSAESVIVATGGKSIPKMGATGLAYRIAADFGLAVTETRPALVPLTFDPDRLADWVDLRGVATEVMAKSGKTAFREAMLFTHRGLSGPAILQISSYWREGGAISIDFLPGEDAAAFLASARKENGRQHGPAALAKRLPKSLAQWLSRDAGLDRPLAELSDKALSAAATKLAAWPLLPSGSEGYRTAEVTLGGVDTVGLDSRTMMAKTVPGLYFIGECVDVTGWLGGYNFQWAWASGHAAGQVA